MTELAFPGAVGWGRHTQGGRGGRVYHITTLEDYAQGETPIEGSIRKAIWNDHPRTLVFDVGGTIELKRQLTIEHPYITIAGQTAPGGGICLRNGPDAVDSCISARAPHCIFSCIRSAPGPGATTVDAGGRHGDSIDCFGNKPVDREVHHLYYYHCTGRWSVDEICEVYGVSDVTVDGCLWAEPLNLSTHSYTTEDANIGHAKHMLIANPGTRNITVYRTTMTRGIDRHPEMGLEDGTIDLVNCIIDHWGTDVAARGGRKWVSLLSDRYGNFNANIVGCMYRPGANSDDRERIYYSHPDGALGNQVTVYLKDNLDTVLGPIESIYHADPANSQLIYTENPLGDPDTFASLSTGSGTILTPEQALQWATGALGVGASYRLNDRGERLNNRDAVDARCLYDLLHGQGSIINRVEEAGGWPLLDPGTPLDWNENDVPEVFAEMYPEATVDDFLWH